ncbi:MAG: N-acetyl-gamma-glutamyl-phosphate reductase [Hyphomicrobiaceae bacterium]
MTQDTHKIFIDGEAGTTGLQIRDRLADIPDITVLSIDPEKRKDADARQALMREADVSILCLPDDAAREAVVLADALGTKAPRIIDASTAHRTADGWVYGFPELVPGHAKTIANAQRVANPGCYSTGAISLLRPIMESGWIPPDFPLTINAVSGYTGGGKSMIAEFESDSAASFFLYGLSLSHKHLPEIITHSKLERAPIFVPSVGNFAQGMLVSIPIQLGILATPPSLSDIQELFKAYYAADDSAVRFVADKPTTLPVDPAEGTDGMEIYAFGNDAEHQCVLVARLDNLGKGAAGAAVQNLKLMLAN